MFLETKYIALSIPQFIENKYKSRMFHLLAPVLIRAGSFSTDCNRSLSFSYFSSSETQEAKSNFLWRTVQKKAAN